MVAKRWLTSHSAKSILLRRGFDVPFGIERRDNTTDREAYKLRRHYLQLGLLCLGTCIKLTFLPIISGWNMWAQEFSQDSQPTVNSQANPFDFFVPWDGLATWSTHMRLQKRFAELTISLLPWLGLTLFSNAVEKKKGKHLVKPTNSDDVW